MSRDARLRATLSRSIVGHANRESHFRGGLGPKDPISVNVFEFLLPQRPRSHNPMKLVFPLRGTLQSGRVCTVWCEEKQNKSDDRSL